MPVHTNSQKMARAAYQSIAERELSQEFVSFAREFPSLTHSCGLAQAIAFAKAKGHEEYLRDIAAVLRSIGHAEATSTDSLERAIREQPLPTYVRLSRNTLRAAGWLKRYVEAAEKD